MTKNTLPLSVSLLSVCILLQVTNIGLGVVTPIIGLISFSADDSLKASTGCFILLLVLDSVCVSTNTVDADVDIR